MKCVQNTNGVDRTTACLQWLCGLGIPSTSSLAIHAWVDSTDYSQGDIVSTPGNYLWRALADNTNAEPGSVDGSPPANYWASVPTYGERNVIMRDLYFLGPPTFYPGTSQGEALSDSNFGAYPLVDGDFPISYQPYATIPNQGFNPIITFVPFSVEKEKLSYKTGFEASSVNLTLRPRDPNAATAPFYSGSTISPFNHRGIPSVGLAQSQSYSEALQVPAPYSDSYIHVAGTVALYQTMRQGFATTDWYLAPLTMWRTFSPADNPSDVTSYGAAVMFRGRVSSVTVDAEDVKITVSSLMEIFKQKVPTQTIQPGNRWAPYDFNSTPDYNANVSSYQPQPSPGSWNWTTLAVFAGDPSTLSDGTLAEGWALISNGQGVWWRRIYNNVGTYVDTNPSSPTYQDTITTVIFLENLPFNLGLGGNIGIQMWESADTSAKPAGPGAGFQYVPQPLSGIG